MANGIDPASRYSPLIDELEDKEDLIGYTVKYSPNDVGKVFVIGRRVRVSSIPDVSGPLEEYDCTLYGKMFDGAATLDIVACTKDKEFSAIWDPKIAKSDLGKVGQWSLPADVGSERKSQSFSPLELGTQNRSLFIVAFGIRVASCAQPGRVKLRRLDYRMIGS